MPANRLPIDDMLHPSRGSSQRIADEVMAVLRQLPRVRRVAVFGSLADGRMDDWSDVDMWVGYSGAESDAWAVAQAVTKAKSLLYYRKFSLVDPPSGRYWFTDESPFNRLDISFHPIDDYYTRIREPKLYGQSLVVREIYQSVLSADEHATDTIEVGREPATERETQIGIYIYHSLEALKSYLRGKGCPGKDKPRIEGLRNTIPSLSRDARMAGGNIGELAHRVWGMLRQLGLDGATSE